MIAFETLLLGIIFGRVPIQVMVNAPVTTVEIRLDGTTIGTLNAAPWTLEHDFGTDPLPHELTAVGFDAGGHQVGQVVQWVNLGRQKAGVSVALERDPTTGQPTIARVAWNSVLANVPSSVTATLDGAPLRLVDFHRIPLPRSDPAQTHLLSVEVVFAGTVHERADVGFGGDVIDTAESELTGMAVSVAPGTKTLDLGELRHVFTVDGEPQDPVAVETGRAEVALVFDEAVRWADPFRRYVTPRDLSRPPRLAADADRFFAVSTVPVRRHDADSRLINLYPRSPSWRLSWMDDLSVLYALTFLSDHARPQAIPTAVAVAGADAAASGHRRAVVLLLAEQPAGGPPESAPARAARLFADTRDATLLTVGAVKAYLAALDVPLVVWSLTGPSPGPLTAAWGPAEDVSSGRRLRKACRTLGAMLTAQRIVWFAGVHLPQRITLDTSATRVRFAR